MKLSIIANPAAGAGRAYKSLERYVRKWPHSEWEVELLTSNAPDHAGLLARELIRCPPDLLAVSGGDGTLNEVANCIPHPPFPVAILPAGTANVLARELGLPLDPIRALHAAMKRTIRRVDLGQLHSGSERRFLFVAGIGFDAYIVSRVHQRIKRKLGMAAYALEAIRCLRNYTFPEFQVATSSGRLSATSCIVCNAKSYGGGLQFCPDADMTDGLLDIVVLQERHRLGLACFLLRAWFGNTAAHPWIHRLRAKSLKIAGPTEVMVQTDGELAGCLPISISLTEQVFPLVVP
jgi:diacylglycerol kinase (ATP)